MALKRFLPGAENLIFSTIVIKLTRLLEMIGLVSFPVQEIDEGN